MLKLVFDKYVLGLHWMLELSPELKIYQVQHNAKYGNWSCPIQPCLTFLESILMAITLQLKV